MCARNVCGSTYCLRVIFVPAVGVVVHQTETFCPATLDSRTRLRRTLNFFDSLHLKRKKRRRRLLLRGKGIYVAKTIVWTCNWRRGVKVCNRYEYIANKYIRKAKQIRYLGSNSIINIIIPSRIGSCHVSSQTDDMIDRLIDRPTPKNDSNQSFFQLIGWWSLDMGATNVCKDPLVHTHVQMLTHLAYVILDWPVESFSFPTHTIWTMGFLLNVVASQPS